MRVCAEEEGIELLRQQELAAEASAEAMQALAAAEVAFAESNKAMEAFRQREVELGNALEDVEATLRSRKLKVRAFVALGARCEGVCAREACAWVRA